MREGNSVRVQSVTLGRFLTKPYYESLQPVRGELQRQQQRNSKQHKGIIHQETVPHFRVNQGLRKRQQFTYTKNVRVKPGEQAGPESNLSHLCCWNTTCWPTGSQVFHKKGSISEPGIKDTWTERMSRRTEWRSIIQTTIGLLKEFWEASQKRKCMICGYMASRLLRAGALEQQVLGYGDRQGLKSS